MTPVLGCLTKLYVWGKAGEMLSRHKRRVFPLRSFLQMNNLKAHAKLNVFGSPFLAEWFRAPLGVGAIAPSSAFLAKAMTKGISKYESPVIELGPGTGVFTNALLNRGIKPDRVSVVEQGEAFANDLRLKFPDVRVIQDDAAKIDQLSPFEPGTVKTVVCGLPLLSMPPAKVRQIVEASFKCLDADGEFRLFTYGHRCPISAATLEDLKLEALRVNTVFINLPPASVFVVRRRRLSAPDLD